MREITRASLPQKCWIFKKGRHILESVMLPELPYVNLEYESILKSNGIPYRKTLKVLNSILFSEKEVYEYWNSEVFEEKELTLPLFARMPDGSYKYCEKNYSGNVPTAETIEAAQKTQEFLEQEMFNYNQILREVQHYKFAKEKLADSIAVACISTNTPYVSIYEINMNHERFMILRPWSCIDFSDWVAIFDMNKIVQNGYITLQVPKHIAGLVIGQGGTNIKAWAEKIGVKKIQVIPI